MSIKAAFDRLVHPSVTRVEERGRQHRLLQALLVGAVLVAVATAQIVIGRTGGGTALAAIPLVFGIGLMAPFTLMVTARRQFIEPAALALGAAAVAILIAAGGGLASPFAALSAALIVESAWTARTRAALGWGVAAAIAALGAGAGLGVTAFSDLASMAPSPWQWLIPLAYGGFVLTRVPTFEAAGTADEPEQATPSVEEMIGAAVLRLNGAGEVVDASRGTEALLNVAPEIVLGTGLFDRVHLNDRILYLEALADLKEGAAARRVNLRLRMAAEPNAPVSVIYRPCILDLAATPAGGTFVAVLRDNDVAAELEQRAADMRDAADNAAMTKDRLLASVSHELRTPLNAIVGFSELLENEMFGKLANEKQREYVATIRVAGGHLLSVVNAILDVSKLQAGSYTLQPETFSFAEAVRLCLTMMGQEAEAKSVILRADIAENVGTVHCDRRAVQQVLVNLVSNAVKFTPSGAVTISARRRGERLDFTVSDTGIGISAEDLERIGTPFTQVQNDYTRQYDGAGLGLALVKGLLERMGGGIAIESTPGCGTRVHVSLPAGQMDGEGEEKSGTDEDGGKWNDGWTNDGLRKTA
ncbi:sensor histidine kinase [Chelativorans sp. YIM 93263]|uniref:sensor histidine kinase n=1 Tax=Chelativorans sp. YIM 93263 TaxID=2906648 RepID=UPI002378C7B8|nr:PAS domain-containing sensor histidine kinase [Chelativorans sp. YIM 93263]